MDNVLPFVGYHVAAYLTLGEVSALAAVNHRWQRLLHKQACWAVRCSQRYGALLKEFAEFWPGGKLVLYERVGAVLARYMDQAAAIPEFLSIARVFDARLVHMYAFLDVSGTDTMEPALVITSPSMIARPDRRRGAVVAAKWGREEQNRATLFNHWHGGGGCAQVAVHVLLLLPESVCQNVPYFDWVEEIPPLLSAADIIHFNTKYAENILHVEMVRTDIPYSDQNRVSFRRAHIA